MLFKSKDGKTWDVGKKFTDLGETNSSRFHLAKLKSGRLILIFNNASTRTNMTIFLSNDDGATWPYKMVIDTDNDVSYPDMIESDPGILNIVYDYARATAGTINFVTIKESDIIVNSKTEVFRTKISSLQ
ncbi:sialidase family protein [Flavobacterium sp. MDT1-60]|uniref:exo-alpha-sialidase n=1 Tax=Flavobacterium sp. MDT1-60 TaxID=1979344 RepID=UPI00177E596D|nr:sialidase family protein [Flavobacterium sp. MDT1-60]QOG04907.1 exo-alpha-sialidase [Flavobacterium sp. MDT1-60]